MSSPLRAPQDICGMAILSIYIALSVRDSSLMVSGTCGAGIE